MFHLLGDGLEDRSHLLAASTHLATNLVVREARLTCKSAETGVIEDSSHGLGYAKAEADAQIHTSITQTVSSWTTVASY